METSNEIEDDKRCTLFDAPRKYCLRCAEFHTAAEWSDGCVKYVGSKPIKPCRVCGGWHPIDRWGANCLPLADMNRSDLASPSVVRDALDGVTHPVTGLPVDSKRALRADYRRRGLEEVGDQEQKRVVHESSEREIVDDIKRSMQELSSLSQDETANMLRSEAPTALGITTV